MVADAAHGSAERKEAEEGDEGDSEASHCCKGERQTVRRGVDAGWVARGKGWSAVCGGVLGYLCLVEGSSKAVSGVNDSTTSDDFIPSFSLLVRGTNSLSRSRCV